MTGRFREKTKTYEGKPCRKCGNTTRYFSTRSCVDCQCRRSSNISDTALWRPSITTYGVQPEFSNWTKSPILSETLNDLPARSSPVQLPYAVTESPVSDTLGMCW